jgi:histidinol dehydrogenase
MKILRDGPLRPRRRPPTRALRQEISAVLGAVRRQGDAALVRHSTARPPLRVDRAAQRRAFRRLGAAQRAALEAACRHQGAVTRRQLSALKQYDAHPTSGVTLYHRRLPLHRIGILLPPARVSVLVASAIPAAVAGVEARVVCTAAGEDGEVAPLMLAAAYMCDVTELYAVGGVAAIGAMAHGTQSLAPVDRILADGGPEVRQALEQVRPRCAVDPNTGPQELLVLADRTASAQFVAADLLAHAESAPEADCALVALDEALARRVQAQLRNWLRDLEKDDPVRPVLRRARARVAEDLPSALRMVNEYAPQRLSLMVQRPDDVVAGLRSYGTLLVGPHTPASLAEFASGGPALLPAGGRARGHGASGIAALQRPVDAQQVDPSAYPRLARVAAVLAEAEGRRHARRALDIRMYGPQ